MKHTLIDNSRPDNKHYPRFKAAIMHLTELLTKEGQYIVDNDGDIMIVTSGNDKAWPNEFIRSINVGWIRAKYLGNEDDSMVAANQIRFATQAEIAMAKEYKSEHIKVASDGQAVLL